MYSDALQEAWGRLKAAFPGSRLSKESERLYLEKLGRRDERAVIAAIEETIESATGRIPSIGQLLERVSSRARDRRAYEKELPDWEVTQPPVDDPGWRGHVEMCDDSVMAVSYDDLCGPDGKRGYPNNVSIRAAAMAKDRLAHGLPVHRGRGKDGNR